MDKPLIKLFNITEFEKHLRDVMLISGVEILEGENWWEAYVVPEQTKPQSDEEIPKS